MTEQGDSSMASDNKVEQDLTQTNDIQEGSEGVGSGSEDSDNSVWEELSAEPSDGEFSCDTDSEGRLEINDHEKLVFGEVSELQGDLCICKTPKDTKSSISLMAELVNLMPSFDNTPCIINNIINCYNIVYSQDPTPITSYKLAFCDYFYRLRHESLFKVLCLSFNIPVVASDMSFRELGIESDRTPDYIDVKGDNVIIIEVTAVSSIEKAAQMKGIEQMGFESKYRREIDMLIDMGKNVVYMPIFFDMSNPTSVLDKEQMFGLSRCFKKNEPYYKLLSEYSKQLAILTSNIRNSLILPSAVLFSTISPLKSNHPSISFMYRAKRAPIILNNYKEIVVSPYIYNKITNDKERMYRLLDNSKLTDLVKAVFTINPMSHRINLVPNSSGLLINELREILINNDIIGLLHQFKIDMGGVLIDSTKSEAGIKFYERVGVAANLDNYNNFEKIPLIANHNLSDYSEDNCDIESYRAKVNAYTSTNYHSIHYDPSYEGKIINSIVKFDAEQGLSGYGDKFEGLLGCINARDINIDMVFMRIHDLYLENNSFREDSMPIKSPKMKQPFLLPIANLNESSYCELEYKNIHFIKSVARLVKEKNPFTSLVLEMAVEDNYKMYSKPQLPSKTLLELQSRRHELSNGMNQLQRKTTKHGGGQVSRYNDPEIRDSYVKIRDEYKKIQKLISDRKRMEGITDQISYIRMPIKRKGSHFRSMYDAEMTHFKDRKSQSTIEGVGIINNIQSDYDDDLAIFRQITEMLTEDRGENPDQILDEFVSEDACLLKDFKNKAINDYKALINEVRRSYLGHSSAFVSRLAHSLMFYSQLPFGSDNIRVDNLGYKNALLLVRGGKKIFKSKSSKLFRIIYPISEELLPWYTKGHKQKGSFTVLNINGDYFGMTPWAFFHESILTDSISFYSRITSFTFLNLNPKVGLKEQFDKVVLNVLLGFHNRRQTEVMLANMRYILLSTLGDFTGVTQILPEFFGFNYDRFQSFIRNSLFYNYPRYFSQLQELKDEKGVTGKEINLSDFVSCRLKNIFTLSTISNVEDLALMIYSTFLMTKAPYQKLAERARNLKGILEIHELFDGQVGLNGTPLEQTEKISVTMEGKTLEEYSKSLFEGDFNFDPKFCALVGNFVDSIFKAGDQSEGIEAEWIRILNQPWDEMATSTGLRGNYQEVEDFWGQKGYFVVYKQLLSQPTFSDNMLRLFDSEIDDDSKRKMLRSMNEQYRDKLNPEQEFLIFHAVDKVQWRGGREIYVMDIVTKAIQQPIEKFMASLCKRLDNELISIPSDRRAQVIHHSIFEKDLPLKEMLTWYLTLDCSKWAPKSVFVKFVVMLLNMSTVPNSFKTHFMNYIEKLFKKRVYFNDGEVNVLEKNPRYSAACKNFLKKDKNVGGYYLEMPYSWVMGIFNYTSSFLHAANQKYLSYILMKTSLLSYREETSLVMFAHSDDSGGRLSVSSQPMACRALVLYEIFLKSCNHILSKKKSVISRIYFEILSVIYLFKKLLALLPKFLGGLRFLPTDKGPAQDMLQSYSKSIEVMVAGSDFSVSYLVLKVYSMLVWRFYYHRAPTSDDYNRPVQYLGMPDAHPLFVLLCGSDSDILRLIRNGVDITKQMTFVNTMSKNMEGEGPIKPLQFEIKVKGIKRGFEDYLDCFKEILGSWSIRNVNYHSTAMNTFSFLRKLNDSGFVGSLVNESTTRRISRCYFIRSGESSITRLGNVKLMQMMDSLVLCQNFQGNGGPVDMLLREVLSQDQLDDIKRDMDKNEESSVRSLELLKKTLKSPLRIYKYLNMITLEGRKFNESSRTLKPTHVQLVKSARVFSVDFDPASAVSFMKEPELRWALPNVKGIQTAVREVNIFLSDIGYNVEDVDADTLLRVFRTYGRENTKNIYLYSRVPSEIRQIKTYAAFMAFLSVNSVSGMEVPGLVFKMSEKEMGRDYVPTNILEEVYMVNNIVNLMTVFINRCGSDFMKSIPLNPVEELDWQGGTLQCLVDHLGSFLETDVRYGFVTPQLEFLKSQIEQRPVDLECLRRSGFYTFLKNQKSRSGWYGLGEVYISIENNFYSFNLENSTVTSVYTNKSGKLPMHHSDFILDVFSQINVDIKSLKRPRPSDYSKKYFGWDCSSELSILPAREIEFGIPCVHLTMRNSFVDHIENLGFKEVRSDTVIVETGDEFNRVYKKIHLLPLKKSELTGTIKQLISVKSFENKIMEYGINDFEEFIYTEILTEYGKDVYVDFDELIDNYTGSRLYEVFRKVDQNGWSSIPRAINPSPLPASEGSMVRIFIDYSAHSNEKLISTPVDLDPVMMQLRSEYPESVSTLIGSKLSEYHRQIYSKSEIKEISDLYNSISLGENISSRRQALIKLLTYWGYGSLVNTIETFTLLKQPMNYMFFNMGNIKRSSLEVYNDRFKIFFKKLNKVLQKWRPMYNSLEYESDTIRRFIDNDTVIGNYVYHTAMCCYNYVCLDIRNSLYGIAYANLIIACMKEDDFNAELQDEFSDDYILSSLPISWKFRFEFIATLNVLRQVWCTTNKQEFDLNYNVKLQRLPDHIKNPKALINDIYDGYKGQVSYYNGFQNDTQISYILGLDGGSTKNGLTYRINTRIAKISEIAINMCESCRHPRPLTADFMEHDNFEDLNYECGMAEPDEEEIEFLLEGVDVDKYKPSTIRQMKVRGMSIIQATVFWVFAPNSSSCVDILKYIRQVGENVVVVTDTYFSGFIKIFPNSGCRIVNFTKMLKVECKPSFLFYTFNKKLNNPDFLSLYLKGQEFRLDESIIERLKPNYLRDVEAKICLPEDQGYGEPIDLIIGETKIIERDGHLEVLKSSDIEEEPATIDVRTEEDKSNDMMLEKIQQINNLIKKIESDCSLSKESLKNIKDRYTKKEMLNNVPLSVIMRSMLSLSELSSLNSLILENKSGISASDQKKMFLSPEFFTLARGVSKTDLNPIKDKKLRSELSSFHKDLPSAIGSNTIRLSFKFLKIIVANLKMWLMMAKNARTKCDNKKFLITLFMALCNNVVLSNDESDDGVWQEIVNKVSLYMTEEEMDEDDIFGGLFSTVPASRIRYRSDIQ